MRHFDRLMLVVALTVFAAATVVQAAGSARMAVEMAQFDAGMADMAGCVLCEDGPDGAAAGAVCDLVCNSVSSVALEVPAFGDLSEPDRLRHAIAWAQDLMGETTLPDRQPPRFHS